MNKKNILLLEQFVYPDGWAGAEFPTKIAIFLAQNKYDVIIICGNKPSVKSNMNYELDPKNFKVKLIKINTPFENKNFIFKLLNQIIFCSRAFFKIFKINNLDLILCFTNPPQMIIFASLISFLKKIPFAIIAMDLYPEALMGHIRNKFFLKIIKLSLEKIFNRAYKSAKGVVCLGKRMKLKVINKGVDLKNIQIISNWATGDINISESNIYRKKWNIKAKKVILYSGNLGLAHDYITILKAIKKSKLTANDLQLIFVATGKNICKAKLYAEKELKDNMIIFKELVHKKDFSKTLAIADLALVSIRDGFDGLVYPSKFQGYISRSLPILYIGPKSDISDIIEKFNIGIWFKNFKINQLSNFLKEFTLNKFEEKKWQRNSILFYEKFMSEKISLANYLKFIDKILI